MINRILILALVLVAGLQQASARVSVGKTEIIKVVHEFPDTEDYMTNPGRYIDLGILYETFGISGAPLWVTKDPILVGTENMNTEYYMEIDDETKEAILAEHNLIEEDLTQLSFMDKHSGFLWIIAGFVLFVIISKFFGGKDEDIIEDIPAEEKV